MSPIEIVAALLGAASVILTARQSLWCWPVGILNVILYIFIFYEVKLYSDVGLQVVFLVLQIYGWWAWVRGGPKQDNDLPVVGLSGLARLGWVGLGLAGAALLGTLTSRYTDAALPYPDALIASLSLVAQALLARKVWESWLFWIVVDLTAVPVYLSKALLPTAVLYGLFLFLAASGLVQWRRSLAADSSSANSSRPTADIAT